MPLLSSKASASLISELAHMILNSQRAVQAGAGYPWDEDAG
jgi:hypothetical protein